MHRFALEFLVITYRTDPRALRSVLPPQLALSDPEVTLAFIHEAGPQGLVRTLQSIQTAAASIGGRACSFAIPESMESPDTTSLQWRPFHPHAARSRMLAPRHLMKVIPSLSPDGTHHELVGFVLKDVCVQRAWTAPIEPGFPAFSNARTPRLPVLQILEVIRFTGSMSYGSGYKLTDAAAQEPDRSSMAA